MVQPPTQQEQPIEVYFSNSQGKDSTYMSMGMFNVTAKTTASHRCLWYIHCHSQSKYSTCMSMGTSTATDKTTAGHTCLWYIPDIHVYGTFLSQPSNKQFTDIYCTVNVTAKMKPTYSHQGCSHWHNQDN
jgi:hypothetical protein